MIGSDEYKKEYVREKVDEWIECIQKLSKIARTQPHAAYICYVKGFSHKYTYFMRTIPNISTLLGRLDQTIDDFLKVLFDNHEFSRVERNLWSLPVRLGGLGVPIPSQVSDEQYEHSRLINEKLTSKVISQQKIYEDINMEVNKVKSTIKAKKEERHQNLKALEASQEKGASSWLNVLPLKSQGFFLDKQSFRVAIYTRYGIPHKRLPSHCVCGTKFTVEHALNCKKGGFITSRHNDLRRITADFLKEVCLDVEEEPLLQEITGEVFQAKTAKTEKEARLDVAARGFWMRGQKLFCDIRVFNPLAKCYRKNPLAKIHEKHEKEKKIKYAERVIGAWEFHTACVLMFWRNEPRMWSLFQASSREGCREEKHCNKRGHLFPANQTKLLIGEIAGPMHMWLPVSLGQPIMYH